MLSKKITLLEILEKHATEIQNLQFKNYNRAEYLFQRTKMLYAKFFPKNTLYLFDLSQLNIKDNGKGNTELERWNDWHNRLMAIAQAMVDDVQLSHVHHNENKTIQYKVTLAIVALLIFSLALWSLNSWLKWDWLSSHPKRIPLFLSTQLAFIFIFTLFITNDAKTRIVEWTGIGVSIIFGIISFIQ